MDYTTYNEILESIENKAPLESGVQALIYMLIFEKIKDKNCDVVIIDKMQKNSVFMSYGAISDLAIVDKGFNYYTSDRTKIKMCIEVKATYESINNKKNKEQVKEQLLTYKKAIITNGKEWAFYELDTSFYTFDKSINEVIELERELATERGGLKSLFQRRTNLVKKNVSTKDIEEEIKVKKEGIDKLDNKVSEKREKIDNQIDYGSIQAQEGDCFKIDNENSFELLCDKINKFIV